MSLIRKNILIITGVVVGAAAGYLYYYFVGCSNGTCSITSSPVNSTLYGALMGGLFLSFFKKNTNTKENKNEKDHH